MGQPTLQVANSTRGTRASRGDELTLIQIRKNNRRFIVVLKIFISSI